MYYYYDYKLLGLKMLCTKKILHYTYMSTSLHTLDGSCHLRWYARNFDPYLVLLSHRLQRLIELSLFKQFLLSCSLLLLLFNVTWVSFLDPVHVFSSMGLGNLGGILWESALRFAFLRLILVVLARLRILIRHKHGLAEGIQPLDCTLRWIIITTNTAIASILVQKFLALKAGPMVSWDARKGTPLGLSWVIPKLALRLVFVIIFVTYAIITIVRDTFGILTYANTHHWTIANKQLLFERGLAGIV